MLTTCLLFLIPRRPACHVHDDLTRSPHPTTHTLSSDMDLFLTAGRLLRTSQCHLYGLTMAYVQSGYGSTDIVTFSYRCTKSSFMRRGFRWRSTCQAFGVRLPPSEILFFISSSWSRFLHSHDLFYWHSEQFASFFLFKPYYVDVACGEPSRVCGVVLLVFFHSEILSISTVAFCFILL
jgi:hypothetical protein